MDARSSDVTASELAGEPPAMPTRYRPPGVLVRVVILVLALAAAVLAGVLTWQSAGIATALPGCGPGSGCDVVLASRWAKLFGVPVSLPALAIYGAMFVAAWFIDPRRSRNQQRQAWAVLILGSAVALAAAAWFVGVQILALGALCRYCTATHAVGVVLAILVLSNAPIGRRRLTPEESPDPMLHSPATAWGLAGLAVLAVAALAAAQFLQPHRTLEMRQADAIEAQSALLPFVDPQLDGTGDSADGPRHQVLGAPFVFDPSQYPTLGSTSPDLVLLEMFDYTCPHCRRFDNILQQTMAEHEGRIAVIALPTPLDPACNPYEDRLEPVHENACEIAKLALAVWRVDREAFESFHHWLFAADDRRTLDETRAEAERRVGAERLAEALQHPWIDRQIAANIRYLAYVGRFSGAKSLPQFVARSAVFRGVPESADEFADQLASLLD